MASPISMPIIKAMAKDIGTMTTNVPR